MADANWDDVRLFLAVSRAESLSGAGRTLRLDPATLGRRIARLEQVLDTALFVKSPQGYALTAEGERFLTHAEQAERSIAEASEHRKGDQLSGQIRIGAPDGCANFVLPQVCAAISAENPGLEIQIVALPRVFNLSKREADMAVGVSPPQTGRMTVRKITDYRLHLWAARSYLDRAPRITALQDLRDHRIVGYIPDMIFDKELDYIADLGAGRLDLASNSVSVQFHMVNHGAGLGVVHDFAIPFGQDLVRVLPDQLSLTRAFYLIRPEDDRKLDRMNRLADAVHSGIRAEVARLEALA
ncbi:LysR family transcriptional regulator [Aliiroseovarius sp. PTFE2010]|uniref:LysR family transcriptional regulator n=1 Tax=Aliiroseovarius sp. PTFE2010 TaxID=3417190 RepID=UPI003CE6F107